VLALKDPAGNVLPTTWADVLAGTQYAGWPLNSVTFSDLVDLIQNPPAGPNGLSLIANASIYDLDSSGAVFGQLSLLSLLLFNAPLTTLSDALASPPADPTKYWCDLTSPYTKGTCVVKDPNTTKLYSDATLLELAMYGVPSTVVPVSDILMSKLTPALNAPTPPALKSPLAYALVGDFTGTGSPIGTPLCATATTLGQCLAQLITPTDFPWEDLPLDKLNLGQYALGQRAPVTVQFGVGTLPTSATITLPVGFAYDSAAGTTMCQFAVCTPVSPSNLPLVTDPTVLATTPQVLTFASGLLPPGLVTLSFKIAPDQLLSGAPGQSFNPGTLTVALTNGVNQPVSTSGPAVTDPWLLHSTPAVTPNTFYFGALTPGSIDKYDITLPKAQQGSWLSVKLSALTASDCLKTGAKPCLDGDLTLFGASAPASSTAAVNAAPALRIGSTAPLPDPGTANGSSLAPDTLQDVPTAPTSKDFPFLRAVAANRGATDDLSTVSEGSSTTDTKYRIQVSAYGTSSGPYAMRVIATPSGIAACPTTTFGGTVGSQPDSSPIHVGDVAAPQGLIVYNTTVTSTALLGTDGVPGNTLFALAKATNSWLLPVTPGPNDGWTASAGAPTNFDCTPVSANNAVQAIAAVIKTQKTLQPTIQNIVLIGGDDRLPMYRQADTTTLANEKDNADAIGTDNPIAAASRDRFFLTDDPYGTLNPLRWLDRAFYVPDLAVGRVVETDSEITGQIAQYRGAKDPNGNTSPGRLDPRTALVTGYDFMADSADATASTLANASYSTTTKVDEIGFQTPPSPTPAGWTAPPGWTAQDLHDALLANPGIVEINTHFSQYVSLSSHGDASKTFDVLDVLSDPSSPPPATPDPNTSTAPHLPTGILAGSILFSAGCHAGLSVPDAYADPTKGYPLLPNSPGGVSKDWAQALGSRSAAVWVANTGYGYGTPDGIALSERLMTLYAKYLIDPTTSGVGDALVKAKQEYFSGQGVYASYDEKALQQVVLYGIPTFRLGTQTGVGGTTAGTVQASVPSTGGPATAAVNGQTFTTTAQTGVNGGTFYSVNGETLTENGYPITPKTSFDVTANDPTLVARGATIESITTKSVSNILPEIARSTIDRVGTETSTRPATVVFPTTFQSVSGTSQHQRLVVYPGQFSDTDPSPGADTGTETLLTNGSFNVYYASTAGVTPSAGDVTPPFVQSSAATGSTAPDGTTVVLFQVAVTDPVSVNDTTNTRVRRVFVQYDDQPGSPTDHTWKKVELTVDPNTPDVYVGAVTAAAGGRYLVQAIDGAGNVAVSQFKGSYYDAPANGPIAPQAVATVIASGPLSTTGWYTSGAQVALFVNGQPVTGGYHWSSAGIPSTQYSGPFDAPQGLNTIAFTADAGGPVPPDLVVQHDTAGPTVTLDKPISVITDTENVAFTGCTAFDTASGIKKDAAGNDCTLSTTSVALSATSQHVYTLTSATASDNAGNSTTVGQTAVILSGATHVLDATGVPIDNQFTAPNAVTIIAAGQQFADVGFTILDSAGQPAVDAQGNPLVATPGTNTKTIVIPNPGTYAVTISVPGLTPITFSTSVVDTPPILNVPTSVGPVEATGPTGAVVNFSVFATDVQDPVLTPTCVAASGSMFPVNPQGTQVKCSVTDSGKHTVTASFPVYVVDTTPPAITLTAQGTILTGDGNVVSVEGNTLGGANVDFSATATDTVDTNAVATCPHISPFPVGTTKVTCTAKDYSNNTSTRWFIVSVSDTTPPVVTVPASFSVEGNTLGGANVDYLNSVTATDIVDGTKIVGCLPAPGTFKLGATVVTCTTTDTARNIGSASFTVTVVDTTVPTMTQPADIMVKTNNYNGIAVTWASPVATDIVAGTLPVACTPPSGSTFKFGATTVSCTAKDQSGNTTTKTFKVTVVVMYRYDGDDLPIHEGSYDTYGLNRHVNSEPGGKYVLFKWKAYDNLTGVQLVDPTKVEVYFESYSSFVARWGKPAQIPSKTALPAGNVCADGTRTTFALGVTTVGASTPIKFVNGEFNAGFKLPAKPSAANNCFVQWSRIVGDPAPGIVSLFVLT
jgi:hypothetical protein